MYTFTTDNLKSVQIKSAPGERGFLSYWIMHFKPSQFCHLRDRLNWLRNRRRPFSVSGSRGRVANCFAHACIPHLHKSGLVGLGCSLSAYVNVCAFYFWLEAKDHTHRREAMFVLSKKDKCLPKMWKQKFQQNNSNGIFRMAHGNLHQKINISVCLWTKQ